MNKRLLLTFMSMVPVVSVQAADKASGSLARIEGFNFATDPLKSFPVDKAFTDRLKSKGLGEAFSSVLLLTKLQNAPIDNIDNEFLSAIDDCQDDFFRGTLKKELVLKQIKESQIILDDEHVRSDFITYFIARNFSEADIDSLMRRAGDEVTSELPFLQDMEQDEKQANDLKSQEKFDHLQRLRFILKLESRIRERESRMREGKQIEARLRPQWEEQARLEAQRAEFDRLMRQRQEEEQARIELQRREEARLEYRRLEDAYNNRNFILRFIGNLFPPR